MAMAERGDAMVFDHHQSYKLPITCLVDLDAKFAIMHNYIVYNTVVESCIDDLRLALAHGLLAYPHQITVEAQCSLNEQNSRCDAIMALLEIGGLLHVCGVNEKNIFD